MKKLICFAILSLISAFAFSATAICEGKIAALSNHVPGGVHVSLEGKNVIKLCNPEQQLYRTTPENCKQIYSMAAMAFAADYEVLFYVDNAPTTSCSDIQSWHAADLRYFVVQKQ